MMRKCIISLIWLLFLIVLPSLTASSKDKNTLDFSTSSITDLLKSGYYLSTNRYEFLLSTENENLNNADTSLSSKLIPINLITTNLGNDDIVRLDWTESAPGEVYHIMRDDGTGFIEIGTTTNRLFYDTISFPYCTYTTFSYRIDSDAGNSNTEFESLSNFRPEDPIVTLVTVNNSLAEVHWSPSTSDAVSEYIIERNIPPWETYYTTGNTDTVYIDDNAGNFNYLNPCGNIVVYTVRAKDLCGTESPGDNKLIPHNNILLTGNTSENCERKAALEWNAYLNMDPPVTEYIVQKSFDGVNFTDIYTLVASPDQLLEYTDPEMLEPLQQVTYRIVGVNGERTAFSCNLPLTPSPDIVNSFEISNVTVTDNTFITLFTESDPSAVPLKVEIYRISDGAPELLITTDWNPSGVLTFEDHDVEVSELSYTYAVKALDDCDFIIAESQEFNSLLLAIGVDDNNNVSLYWNNHTGWGADLQHYLVYKYNDGILESGYPVTVNASLTDYDETDNSDALQTTYVVEAISNVGAASRSNEVLLPRNAEIDIPTAFRPTSNYADNRDFNPVLKNIDRNSYLFIVYNRWGQQVFETRDPLKGWDGSFNGEIQQGIYVYQVSFRDQAGNDMVKRGSVILVK